MRELLDHLDRWAGAGEQVVVARVVSVEGSAPRLPGAAMAVSAGGEVVGSVSGGCVEGAVVEEARDLLGGGGAPRLVHFGYSDEEGFAVGLTCGGSIGIFLELADADDLHRALAEALRAGDPVALATIVSGPGAGAKLLVGSGREPLGSLGDPDLERVVARDALGFLDAGQTTCRRYGLHGEAREDDVAVFVESFASPPEMVIVGAVDFTAALAQVARLLGFRVSVCDPREVFATKDRFPMAHEVVLDWPDRHLGAIGPQLGPRDAVCVLTHDHKFDIPALAAALRTDAGYVGAMGSRRTHEDRLVRLREAGVDDEALGRLMSPIGLDIGARTPEETAIAICAEIIAARTGRSASSLRDTEGPIHP